MLTYHIYNDSFWGWKWTVKDPTKENVLYAITRERHLFSSPKFHVYAGPTDSSPWIATIERSHWNRRWHIHIHESGEKVPVHSQFFSSRWLFHYQKQEYHWSQGRNLKDSKGETIAIFEPRRFSWRKVGTLSIKRHEVDKLPVIIETAIIILQM